MINLKNSASIFIAQYTSNAIQYAESANSGRTLAPKGAAVPARLSLGHPQSGRKQGNKWEQTQTQQAPTLV